MANEIVNRTVNVFIQSGEAQKAYDVLIAKEKKLNEELAKTSDPKKLKSLHDQLDKLKEPIDRARKKLSGELLPTYKDLQTATTKWLNEFKKTGDPAALLKFQKLNAALNEQKKIINGLAASQKNIGFGGVFAGSFLGNLAAQGLSKIKELFTGALDEFEQADIAIRNLQNDLENFGNIDALPLLTKQAKELAEKFTFLDNDDIVAAQDKLVTFGKLTTAEIQKLIPVIVDYAAKTGVQIPEAADIFIKALEGSGKGIKTFGVRVSEQNGVAKNFNILTTEMAQKVRGAADAFGESERGRMAKFKQWFRDVKEDIGRFIAKLIEGPKTANQIFDEAKAKTDQYEKSLRPLLARYDELKAKTTLNKDEQTELHSIIQKIVEIVPQAATEVNKYGVALDINRQKVDDFFKTNQQFLREKEADAVKELNNQLTENISKLEAQVKVNESVKKNFDAGRMSQQDYLVFSEKATSQIRKDQEKIITQADVLITKYGVKLPAASQTAFDAIRKELSLLAQPPPSAAGLSDADKAAIAARTKEENQEKEKEEKKRRDEAAKKILAERKQLLDDLHKIELDQQLDGLTALDKELKRQEQQFDEFRKRAKGNKEILLEIEKLFRIARLNIIDKFDKEERDRQDSQIKKGTGAGAEPENVQARADALARAELKVLTAVGKEKLTAQLEQLDLEKKAELDNKELTEAQKAVIEEKFRQKSEELELQSLTTNLNNFINYASQALSLFTIFSDAKTAKENAELEADRKRNEKKKQNLERRLNSGKLTQLAYDRELQKIEKDQEKREKEIHVKQFRRQQRADIVQALINGALAVTSTLAAKPGPLDILSLSAFRAINIGLAVATTAAQVAAIASKKPPEFAEGGKLGGRSHGAGGNAVVDGSGRKIAEVEAGEGIVNKRTMGERKQYSVTGTPSQIISKLNSLYGVNWESGATLHPQWKTYTPRRMNFKAMKSFYADGGVFGANTQQSDANTQVLNNLSNVVANMQQTLENIHKNGIAAYTILTQHEKQAARRNAIRNDATMKP